MDVTRFSRLAELFESARSLDRAHRVSFIASSCGDDHELRVELQSLLDHHDATHGGLDGPFRPSLSAAADLLGEPFEVLPPPQRVGQYDIEELLGEGGMGIVYRARQHHPPRDVALKLLRHTRLGPLLLRRFEFEAAVLARLSHPGIAQIFEAGVVDHGGGARPYFAMEFVEGAPLSTHLATVKPDLRSKLRLYIGICEAVHHAHQKGVIHRDLKPANVLITKDGQPKILDFGVARATDADLQLTTVASDVRQLIGTLPYMSPEQVEGRAAQLDTRSDVYSLGVILYEMLAGRLPYDLEGKALSAAARAICEQSPRRLDTIDRTLSSDLNTIILKSLDKDPQRRYQSASELAADIARVLRDEPIMARPATRWYRFRKFARRNRAAVIAAAVAIMALLAGLVGSTIALMQARHQANRMGAINQFMSDVLTTADPNRTRAGYPFAAVLDDAGDMAAMRFADHADIEAEVRFTLSRAYWNLAQWPDAELHAKKSWELRRDALGPRHIDTLHSQYMYMRSVNSEARANEAEQLAMQIMELLPHDQRHSAVALQTRQTLAIIRGRRGECADSEQELRDCLEIAERVYGPVHEQTLVAKNNLVVQLLRCITRAAEKGGTADYSETVDLLQDVVDGDLRLDVAAALNATNSTITLARALRKAGQLDEAELHARRAVALVAPRFGERHNLNIRAHRELAEVLYLNHEFEDAAAAALRSVDVAIEVYGTGHVHAISPMSQALPMLDAAEVNDVGERFSRELLERFRNLAGHDPHAPVRYQAWLALFLTRQGRLVESQEVINQASAELGPGASDETRALLCLAAGQLARDMHDFDEAERQVRMALELSPPSPLLDPLLREKAAEALIELSETVERP